MNIINKKINFLKIVPLIIILWFFNISIICYAEDILLGNISIVPFPRHEERRQTFSYKLQPGDEIIDYAIVYNGSNFEKKVITFAADHITTDEGGSNYNQYYDTQTKVGNWIILNETILDIPDHFGQVVQFTIKVPENIKSKEYIGGILAQDIVGEFDKIGLRVAKEINIDIVDSSKLSDVKKYQEKNWEKIVKKKTFFNSSTFFIISISTLLIILFTTIFIYREVKKKK